MRFKSVLKAIGILSSGILLLIQNPKTVKAEFTNIPSSVSGYKTVSLASMPDDGETIYLSFTTADYMGGIREDFFSSGGQSSNNGNNIYYLSENGSPGTKVDIPINNWKTKDSSNISGYIYPYALFYKSKNNGITDWTNVGIKTDANSAALNYSCVIANALSKGSLVNSDLFDADNNYNSKILNSGYGLAVDELGQIKADINLSVHIPKGYEDIELCFGYRTATEATAANLTDYLNEWGNTNINYFNPVKLDILGTEENFKWENATIFAPTSNITAGSKIYTSDLLVKYKKDNNTVTKYGFGNIKFTDANGSNPSDYVIFPIDGSNEAIAYYQVISNGEIIKQGTVDLIESSYKKPTTIQDANLYIKSLDEDNFKKFSYPTWDKKAALQIRVKAEDSYDLFEDLKYQIYFEGVNITGDNYIKASLIDKNEAIIDLDTGKIYEKLQTDQATTGSFEVRVKNSVVGDTVYASSNNYDGTNGTANVKGNIENKEIWSSKAPEFDLTVSDEDVFKAKKIITATKTSSYNNTDTVYYYFTLGLPAENYKTIVDNKNKDDSTFDESENARNNYVALLKDIKNSEGYQREIESNGTFYCFMTDVTGNISYKKVTENKIANNHPVIQGTIAKYENETPLIEVIATADGSESILYRLNDGPWQTSNTLTGVKDGNNVIYVKTSETNLETKVNKYVYLDALKNEEAKFSPRTLYGYINQTPSSWTNKKVEVSINLPADYYSLLAQAPYSFDGGNNWTTDNTFLVSENATVKVAVKDIYGYKHLASTYDVTNIDDKLPVVNVVSSEASLTISAQDVDSGIHKISIVGGDFSNEKTIKQTTQDEVKSVAVSLDISKNGAYIITVLDTAGNSIVKTVNVASIKSDKDKDSTKNTSTKTSSIPTLTPIKSPSSTSNKSSKDNGKIKEIDSIDVFKDIEEEMDVVFRNKSNAGHSTMKPLTEAEEIDIYMTENSSLTTPSTIPVAELNDESSSRFSRAILFLVLIILTAAIATTIVFIDWKPILKKYNINLNSLKFWEKKPKNK